MQYTPFIVKEVKYHTHLCLFGLARANGVLRRSVIMSASISVMYYWRQASAAATAAAAAAAAAAAPNFWAQPLPCSLDQISPHRRL